MALTAQSKPHSSRRCAGSAPGPLRKLSFPALGTTCEVQYVAPDGQQQAATFENAAVSWVNAFEAKYTRFRPTSLSAGSTPPPGSAWVEIDEEMEQLLKLCDTLYHDPGGAGSDRTAADPTLELEGGATGACLRTARSPPRDVWWAGPRCSAVRDGYSCRNREWRWILADSARSTPSISSPRSPANHGIENVLVDFGHDLRALGLPPGRPAWHIGLEDPQQPGQLPDPASPSPAARAWPPRATTFAASGRGPALRPHHRSAHRLARGQRLHSSHGHRRHLPAGGRTLHHRLCAGRARRHRVRPNLPRRRRHAGHRNRPGPDAGILSIMWSTKSKFPVASRKAPALGRGCLLSFLFILSPLGGCVGRHQRRRSVFRPWRWPARAATCPPTEARSCWSISGPRGARRARRRFPAFTRLQADFAARGLAIVAISVDENPAAYGAFVRKMQPTFPTVRDQRPRAGQSRSMCRPCRPVSCSAATAVSVICTGFPRRRNRSASCDQQIEQPCWTEKNLPPHENRHFLRVVRAHRALLLLLGAPAAGVPRAAAPTPISSAVQPWERATLADCHHAPGPRSPGHGDGGARLFFPRSRHRRPRGGRQRLRLQLNRCTPLANSRSPEVFSPHAG